jgi:hypothetical protein
MVRGMTERTRPYARPRTVRLLADAVLFAGLALAVFGVAYAVNGATQAHADVEVPVALTTPEAEVPVPLPRGDLPPGARLEVASDQLMLRAWDSTVAEQLTSRGDMVLFGLAASAASMLLRRLLLSIAEGQPFRAGNARRIAALAALVAVAGTVGPVLPELAALMVLDRVGLAEPGGPFRVGVSFPLTALLVAPVLLALAEAFRRGAELADDVRGLV